MDLRRKVTGRSHTFLKLKGYSRAVTRTRSEGLWLQAALLMMQDGGGAPMITSEIRLPMDHEHPGPSEFAPHKLVSLRARPPGCPAGSVFNLPLLTPFPHVPPPHFCRAAQAARNQRAIARPVDREGKPRHTYHEVQPLGELSHPILTNLGAADAHECRDPELSIRKQSLRDF